MFRQLKLTDGKIAFSILAVIVILGIAAPSAQAHMSTTGYSEISIAGNKLKYQLYLDPGEVGQWIDSRSDGVFVIEGASNSKSASGEQVTWTEEELLPLIEYSLAVENNGVETTPTIDDISIKERAERPYLFMNLEYEFSEPIETYKIDYHFFFDDLDPLHQNITIIRSGEAAVNTVFHKDHRVASDRISMLAANKVTMPVWAATMVEYTKLGVGHIWTGIDHLLFIIALVLLKQRKRDYLKILTAFTVGHSVTIALSALDIVNIPTNIIEPVIALSITYVAVENIWIKKLEWRWIVALLFGLIHGFGFAQVLRGALGDQYLLSLFSFNLGVETGQIAVLAVLLPLLVLAGSLRWYRAATYSISSLIAIVGFYWFVERIG
ncbi:HupE/UreJ family protein [Paenibacillus sp. sptzw28]|uniref:HupE/UreJ family protein n=1 Tax=Paenibacillus sp. sptzw28 TaxID=715179 RepID=UPI001C6E62C7|nr:HupE/UreJ family protein [Paenibacillus sp. sptzw28]QYR21502.1 HupE/UreJ family protein [Paenibacillus sp. sptzw28]